MLSPLLRPASALESSEVSGTALPPPRLTSSAGAFGGKRPLGKKVAPLPGRQPVAPIDPSLLK
eukprot:4633908-Prymnesium_polylepis.1